MLKISQMLIGPRLKPPVGAKKKEYYSRGRTIHWSPSSATDVLNVLGKSLHCSSTPSSVRQEGRGWCVRISGEKDEKGF